MTPGQWGQVAVLGVIGALVVGWIYRRVCEEEAMENEIVNAHRGYTEAMAAEEPKYSQSEAARLLRDDDDERFEDGSGWRNTDEGDEEGIKEVA